MHKDSRIYKFLQTSVTCFVFVFQGADQPAFVVADAPARFG